jgi:hypothetical protein
VWSGGEILPLVEWWSDVNEENVALDYSGHVKATGVPSNTAKA